MNTTRNILITVVLLGLVGIQTAMPQREAAVEAAPITISA